MSKKYYPYEVRYYCSKCQTKRYDESFSEDPVKKRICDYCLSKLSKLYELDYQYWLAQSDIVDNL